MSEPDKTHDPFDSAFKTLVAVCAQLLIPIVNELFGTTFKDTDEVVLMDSKQMKPLPKGKISTREVDSLFMIKGYRTMFFHVECQCRPDNTMVARFWEYDSHIALLRSVITENGVMEVEFPRSAVIYLRHTKNTPDALRVRLKRPNGETTELYEIPVVKMQDHTLDELMSKGLLFLLPFRAFSHEKRLPEYDADATKLEILLDELTRIRQRLAEESDAGHIDALMRHAIEGALTTVLEGLAGRYENVMKGVNERMSGAILDLEVIRIHDKAWEEGEARGVAIGEARGEARGRAEGISEGRADGRLEAYIGLVHDNIIDPSVAAARLRMSESEFMAEYRRARP